MTDLVGLVYIDITQHPISHRYRVSQMSSFRQKYRISCQAGIIRALTTDLYALCI